MFAIKNVPKQQTGVRNVERLELKHIAPGNIIAHIHTRPRNVPCIFHLSSASFPEIQST